MAHLVHGHELEPLDDELFLLGVGESALGVGRQCRRGQGRLAGVAVEQGAEAAGVPLAVTVAGPLQVAFQRAAPGEDRDALRRERLVLGPPELEEVAVEDDVGVEDLPGPRVHSRRAHREARPRGDPAERVVVDVLRIPVGEVGLLTDLDRGGEAGLLEGVVPGLDPLADRLAVLEGNRLLDPEDDRLLRRRDDGRRVGLLEMPAVDEPHEAVLVDLLREVLEGRDEVAHAVVREPRSVAVLRQQAQRVVDGDGGAAGIGHGVDVAGAPRAVGGRDLDLDVVGEALDPRPGGAVAGEGEARQGLRDLCQVGEEDRGQVDDVASRRPGGGDRHAEQHAVGVGEVDRLLFGAALVGEEPHVAADHVDVVVDLAELPHPVIAEAEAHAAEEEAVADAAGDRGGDEKLLAEHRIGEFGVDLVVLPPEGDEAADLRRVLEEHREGGLRALLVGPRVR